MANLDGRRYEVDAQSMVFGLWTVSFETSRILPSVCSTPVVCEQDNDQFCQFCKYSKELSVPHFPDMVFPKNILSLKHKNGATISFVPLDALKLVACNVDPIEVDCAEAWKETRPNAEKKKKPFDWTFTTDYKGTLENISRIEETTEEIDFGLLQQRDIILFYNDLTLFEDELHDHGISILSVKIRVMPTYWFVLLRFFLRVDNVMVRSYETRYFHVSDKDYVLRESTFREAKVAELNLFYTMGLKREEFSDNRTAFCNAFSRPASRPILSRCYLRVFGTTSLEDITIGIMVSTTQLIDAQEAIPLLPLKNKVLEKLYIRT